MTNKEKAEAYIRQALPELMEFRKGCFFKNKDAIDWAQTVELVCYNHNNGLCHFAEADCSVFSCHHKTYNTFRVIGHPIQLQHWLRVLQFEVNTDKWDYYPIFNGNKLHMVAWNAGTVKDKRHNIVFDLRTGQPATEADYQAFNEIVGI